MLQTFPVVYAIKKAQQSVQRQPICIADADHYYIIYEIEHLDHIEYEIRMNNEDK